jgi:glycerophosphoinositol glycerophosphodiesterase
LERAKIHEPINKMTTNALKKFNVTEHHPLGQHFKPEYIMTLSEMLTVGYFNWPYWLKFANNSNHSRISVSKRKRCYCVPACQPVQL